MREAKRIKPFKRGSPGFVNARRAPRPDSAKWREEVASSCSDGGALYGANGAQVVRAIDHAFGAGFVLQHWLAGGRAAVDALFEEPPITTREILFGAADVALADEAAALSPRAIPVLEGEYEQHTTTALGAWIVRVFAGKQGLPVAQRLDAAKLLAADIFSVQYDATADSIVSSWRVRTDSAQAAARWPGLNSPTFQAQLEGEQPEAVMLASEGAPLDLESLAWRPVPDDEQEEAGASSRAARSPFHGRAAACNLRHPTLWSEDHAASRR